MGKSVTALVVGNKARPSVDGFVELVRELWEEELVAHRASVSAGPVKAERVVVSANTAGTGRKLVWKGTDLEALVAAVRGAWDEDVAVYFDQVDLDAFEPAEEEEYEDVEDEGEEGEDEDDGPAPARTATPAKKDDDDGLGEFEIVAPAMVLYALKSPIELAEAGTKKPKSFGPRGAWAALDGEDMSLLADDLGDSWLLEVLEEHFGSAKVGKIVR